jgi:hypothetical protein
LLGLAAWIGELTKLELGEGELGLRRRIGLADSACHAHGLAEALGGESPLTSLQAPFPAQTVEKAHVEAVLAGSGQLLGMGEVLFAQIALS